MTTLIQTQLDRDLDCYFFKTEETYPRFRSDLQVFNGIDVFTLFKQLTFVDIFIPSTISRNKSCAINLIHRESPMFKG